MGIPMHFFIIPLVVLILGPFNAVLVSFLALLVQAFMLGMGGVTTLGVNVLDMGIILSFVVYGVYRVFVNVNVRLAIFISTVAGILAATVTQIAVLTIANTTSLEVLLASLLPYYLMVGVIEGIINIVILEFISRTNNSILEIEKV
jgi:cobalt/nickel transport system permease protein